MICFHAEPVEYSETNSCVILLFHRIDFVESKISVYSVANMAFYIVLCIFARYKKKVAQKDDLS